jgi:anti-sigma B factor antagonist
VERSSGDRSTSPPRGIDLTEPLTVRIEDEAGASIVALVGELDLSTIPRMENPLFEQVRQRAAVLVDLSKLSFIDSSGIGVLIQAFRRSNGTPMHIVIGPGSQVERVFRIAGIERALPVYSDRAEALGALTGGRGDRNGAN